MIGLVVRAAPVIAIDGSGIEVGIVAKIAVFFTQAAVLVAQMIQILLLKAVLGGAMLLAEGFVLPLQPLLFLLQMLPVLSQALLLLLNQLLLALLR